MDTRKIIGWKPKDEFKARLLRPYFVFAVGENFIDNRVEMLTKEERETIEALCEPVYEENKRKDGFYWVKIHKRDWTIAFWHSRDSRWLDEINEIREDSYFIQICEDRIHNPDESLAPTGIPVEAPARQVGKPEPVRRHLSDEQIKKECEEQAASWPGPYNSAFCNGMDYGMRRVRDFFEKP